MTGTFAIPISEFDALLPQMEQPFSKEIAAMLVYRRGTFTIREIASETGWFHREVRELLDVLAKYSSFDPPVTPLLTLDTRISVGEPL